MTGFFVRSFQVCTLLLFVYVFVLIPIDLLDVILSEYIRRPVRHPARKA